MPLEKLDQELFEKIPADKLSELYAGSQAAYTTLTCIYLTGTCRCVIDATDTD